MTGPASFALAVLGSVAGYLFGQFVLAPLVVEPAIDWLAPRVVRICRRVRGVCLDCGLRPIACTCPCPCAGLLFVREASR